MSTDLWQSIGVLAVALAVVLNTYTLGLLMKRISKLEERR